MGFLTTMLKIAIDSNTTTQRKDPLRDITNERRDKENEKVEEVLELADSILEKATKKKDNILKKSHSKAKKATKICKNNNKLKVSLLKSLEHEYLPIQKVFKEKKSSGFFKIYDINSSTATLSNITISPSSKNIDLKPLADLIMKHSPYLKLIRANKHLRIAKSYSLDVDVRVAEIKREIHSFDIIIGIEEEVKNILSALETRLIEIKPVISMLLKKNNLGKKDASRALFLGDAMECFIDSLNCTVLDSTNNIDEEYVILFNRIKNITNTIDKVF